MYSSLILLLVRRNRRRRIRIRKFVVQLLLFWLCLLFSSYAEERRDDAYTECEIQGVAGEKLRLFTQMLTSVRLRFAVKNIRDAMIRRLGSNIAIPSSFIA